jgi:hypothetical protein
LWAKLIQSWSMEWFYLCSRRSWSYLDPVLQACHLWSHSSGACTFLMILVIANGCQRISYDSLFPSSLHTESEPARLYLRSSSDRFLGCVLLWTAQILPLITTHRNYS